MRIFAGHDGGSGCSHYRMLVPLRELARHDGFEVTFADSGDTNDLHHPVVTAADLEDHDVIVAQRWNKHDGMDIWRRARTPYSRLVFETDDDVFAITPDNWNAYRLFGRPDIRDAIEHMTATADLVTVSTEPLAGVMREHNPNVIVLPNCIPGWVLDLPPRPERDRPRIGWGGGGSHGADIGIIAGPLRRFLKRFPGWDVQLNGTDYRPTVKAPPGRAFYAPWIQVNDHPREFYASVDFDIALAPLWPTTFNLSKSGIKAVEAAARGIPVIATDCEAYRPVIEHGVSGFLVRQDHEWLKYMSILAADDGLRARMGKAAQDMARRYVIEDRWQDWAQAYRSLFPGRS